MAITLLHISVLNPKSEVFLEISTPNTVKRETHLLPPGVKQEIIEYDVSLPPDTLTIAYSPEKEDLFLKLVVAFNRSRPPDTPPIRAVRFDMADIIDYALDGKFEAISPDSSIWLSQIERMWQERNTGASPLVGPVTSYALSPVVIATWESTAREMGYPDAALGWQSLMNTAMDDPEFKWGHSSATAASGLLTVIAETCTAAGKLADLTEADVEDTIYDVTIMESTVARYGGESEDEVVMQILGQGGYALDAFIAQEQTVIRFNRNTTGENLVAVYPEEGTFWMDHPLVLLEGDWVTEEQRLAFQAFAEFVTQPEQQQLVLYQGYRPGVSTVSLEEEGSLIRPEYKVDPMEPKILLEVPPPDVVTKIQELWPLTKRPANIYLVADVTMGGDKLEQIKEGLSSFLDQIASDRERVGLATFGRNLSELVALDTLENSRAALTTAINQLSTGGSSAFPYDVTYQAFANLRNLGDRERINVVLLMTDGIQTVPQCDTCPYPRYSLSSLLPALRQTDFPIYVFCVGYGLDADMDVLHDIARATGARAFKADPETIGKLYRLLSAYF